MDFNTQAIDYWIIREPEFDDYWEKWVDKVIDDFSDDFRESNSDWIEDDIGQFDDWLNNLYDRSYMPQKAARIIERSFKIYIKTS